MIFYEFIIIKFGNLDFGCGGGLEALAPNEAQPLPTRSGAAMAAAVAISYKFKINLGLHGS